MKMGIDPSSLGRLALGLCASLLLAAGASRDARAIGAVGFQTWDSTLVHEQVDGVGDVATDSGVPGLASSMANNPDLNGSAWAHTGAFWSVRIQNAPGVVIRVQAADPAQIAPGVSVWAVGGAAAFDGGTTGFGGETSSAGFGTPHSFNAFSPLGATGTLWMQDGQGGNAKELLGYAIAGPSFLDATGWGETIENGAHDMRASDDYATSVTGSAGAGFAELALQGVADGWYLIYAGGTDDALSGGAFTLTVTAVPEPGTASLLVAGAGLLGAFRRRGARAR